MLRFGKIIALLLFLSLGRLTAQVSSSGCYISGALIDPTSTAGCGNSGTNNYCNLASLYVPAFSPTACSTSTSSGGVSHAKGTVYTLSAGCTATIEAEFKNRNYLGVGATATGCSNSAMDGSGDQLYIFQSGGVVASQGATINVPNSTCAAYPTLGVYTFPTSSITTGCNNSDGYVQMIVTGGTFTVGGNSNRADEIITFTINMSGSCGPGCSSVLPIELLHFSGESRNNRIDLKWKVASEKNVDHYVMEKSTDGTNWFMLSTVPATNKDYGTNVSYALSDFYPVSGVNYYKLINVDNDGTIGPAKVMAVNHKNGSGDFWIEQNNEELIVHLKEAVYGTKFQLLNNSGAVVLETSETNGSAIVHLPKQQLQRGLYILRISSQDKLLHSKVIIY